MSARLPSSARDGPRPSDIRRPPQESRNEPPSDMLPQSSPMQRGLARARADGRTAAERRQRWYGPGRFIHSPPEVYLLHLSKGHSQSEKHELRRAYTEGWHESVPTMWEQFGRDDADSGTGDSFGVLSGRYALSAAHPKYTTWKDAYRRGLSSSRADLAGRSAYPAPRRRGGAISSTARSSGLRLAITVSDSSSSPSPPPGSPSAATVGHRRSAS